MRDLINLVENAQRVQAVMTNPRFRRWFAGSKVCDADGLPLVCYHGTTHAGLELHHRGWMHFGTLGAATQRIHDVLGSAPEDEESPHIFPVFLSIKRPVEVDDFTADEDLMLSLRRRGYYPKLPREGHVNWSAYGDPFDVVLEHGDGLFYTNQVEDKGSISWVVPDPRQIWPLWK